MSEEEKKAIKELNHYINITEYWKQKEYTNSEIDNYIKIVLNLLNKEQKEIEELKEMKPLQDLIDTNIIIADYSHNYISKDKIREKIEELKEIVDEDNPDIYIKIDAYQELLEDK